MAWPTSVLGTDRPWQLAEIDLIPLVPDGPSQAPPAEAPGALGDSYGALPASLEQSIVIHKKERDAFFEVPFARAVEEAERLAERVDAWVDLDAPTVLRELSQLWMLRTLWNKDTAPDMARVFRFLAEMLNVNGDEAQAASEGIMNRLRNLRIDLDFDDPTGWGLGLFQQVFFVEAALSADDQVSGRFALLSNWLSMDGELKDAIHRQLGWRGVRVELSEMFILTPTTTRESQLAAFRAAVYQKRTEVELGSALAKLRTDVSRTINGLPLAIRSTPPNAWDADDPAYDGAMVFFVQQELDALFLEAAASFLVPLESEAAMDFLTLMMLDGIPDYVRDAVTRMTPEFAVVNELEGWFWWSLLRELYGDLPERYDRVWPFPVFPMQTMPRRRNMPLFDDVDRRIVDPMLALYSRKRALKQMDDELQYLYNRRNISATVFPRFPDPFHAAFEVHQPGREAAASVARVVWVMVPSTPPLFDDPRNDIMTYVGLGRVAKADSIVQKVGAQSTIVTASLNSPDEPMMLWPVVGFSDDTFAEGPVTFVKPIARCKRCSSVDFVLGEHGQASDFECTWQLHFAPQVSPTLDDIVFHLSWHWKHAVAAHDWPRDNLSWLAKAVLVRRFWNGDVADPVRDALPDAETLEPHPQMDVVRMVQERRHEQRRILDFVPLTPAAFNAWIEHEKMRDMQDTMAQIAEALVEAARHARVLRPGEPVDHDGLARARNAPQWKFSPAQRIGFMGRHSAVTKLPDPMVVGPDPIRMGPTGLGVATHESGMAYPDLLRPASVRDAPQLTPVMNEMQRLARLQDDPSIAGEHNRFLRLDELVSM